MMSADSELDRVQTPDDNNLVRPGKEFCSLLRLAGATKEVFTMKEVMFYLGQYIIQKQLYDQKQQHIVHCSQDALGRVLGVDSFSVKEPQVLFAMITKNLVAVSPDSPPAVEPGGSRTNDGGPQEVDRGSYSPSPEPRRRRRRRRRRSHRSSDPGPSCSVADGEEQQSEEESEDEGRKRRRSDSYSLTFDDSLSWCVIGGLGSGRDRHSSQSSDSHSVSARSEVTSPPPDSDSDNFSVEFEVESIDSDDYDEDDASLSADDQVYEVIFEAEEDDSFDEDTEISEADYWRCVKCEEVNPPLPRNCLRCWTLRNDWLPELSVTVSPSPCSPEASPTKLGDHSATEEAAGVSLEDQDGVDVPDGKRAKTPTSQSQSDSQDLFSSQPSSSFSSQDKPWTPESRPSSWEPLPPWSSPSPPELERSVSAECRLPDSCLDPCLICQSRPKNGCIVHGKTGHLMSCYICAKKLKRRNKLCPVCRLPIQTVVLTYLS